MIVLCKSCLGCNEQELYKTFKQKCESYRCCDDEKSNYVYHHSDIINHNESRNIWYMFRGECVLPIKTTNKFRKNKV